MADMTSGKKGKPHRRRITLLSSGVSVAINVPDWVKFSAGSFVKAFDKSSTSILRVWRQKNGDGVMVYGMRGDGGKKPAAEAYEIVPIASMAPMALDAVAKHCGLEELRKQVTL